MKVAGALVLVLLQACCDSDEDHEFTYTIEVVDTGFPLDSVSFNGQPGDRVQAVFPTFHEAVGTPYSLTVSRGGLTRTLDYDIGRGCAEYVAEHCLGSVKSEVWLLVFDQDLRPEPKFGDYGCCGTDGCSPPNDND